MGTWALLQVVVDIFAALGFFIIIMRISRQPKDDPRLSRGLQLLQSKISVLEDLSDRTETQVGQLTSILDQKAKEVQAKVQIAERSVHEIKVAMERSLDVAKIFQDKIPHQEIIERQNTIKYVQAARLAHQGLSADEISDKVDLPKGEIEFIAKVNREQLQFSEDALPNWAKNPQDEITAQSVAAEIAANAAAETAANDPARKRAEMEMAQGQKLIDSLSRLQFEMQNLDMQLARDSNVRDMSSAFETPRVETGSLQRIGDEFRKACEDANVQKAQPSRSSSAFPPLDQLSSLIPQFLNDVASELMPTSAPAPTPVVAPPPLAAAPVAPAPAAEAPPRDPVLARALAQAKVQAALSRANQASQVSRQALPLATVQSRDLTAARALANENAKSAPLVRKVQFPKIESP